MPTLPSNMLSNSVSNPELAECAHHPTVLVVNTNAKRSWPQYQQLRCATENQLSAGP